jgi:hypothetical protein
MRYGSAARSSRFRVGDHFLPPPVVSSRLLSVVDRPWISVRKDRRADAPFKALKAGAMMGYPIRNL